MENKVTETETANRLGADKDPMDIACSNIDETVRDLVENLEKFVSSDARDPGIKDRCLKLLGDITSAHGILPTSYYLPQVTVEDHNPYLSDNFRGFWRGQLDGRKVLVKTFWGGRDGELLKDIKRSLFRELVAWKHATHKNVLPFLGVSFEIHAQSARMVFDFSIISAFAQHENILNYTSENKEANRLELLAQAACGLEYLHSKGLIHGGVDPKNILISDKRIACLENFGVLRAIWDPTDENESMRLNIDSYRYMAPEVIQPELSGGNRLKESDVYSLAMTAYKVLTDKNPYATAHHKFLIMRDVTSGVRPSRGDSHWVQDQTWELIKECWSAQPDERPSIGVVQRQLSAASGEYDTACQRKNHTEDATTSEVQETADC